MYASRNIRMCNKDCLCLFVCPTGATDTEDGQINASRCLDGCRACVDSCPSGAIYLIPDEYPAPQEKSEAIKKSMGQLLESKSDQEVLARSILAGEESSSPIKKKMLKALENSSRILAEDCARESGYMMPQAPMVKELPR